MRTTRLAVASLVALVAMPTLSAPVAAADASYAANCDTSLRAAATTDAATIDVIDAGTVVTASGTVSGGSWSADCDGSSVSGSTWYTITAVGGTSTSLLYGTDVVYAATGLFSNGTPPPSPYLEGIDVSTWQGAVDYVQVRASGKHFVIAKATEGIGFTDGRWARNRVAVPAAGLRLGAYHYARPDLNETLEGARAEADWFVDQMGLTNGMLVPALDLEHHGPLSDAALIEWVKAWLQEVYDRTGVRPMIYASPYFWRTFLNNTHWFADNGYPVLWIAHWTTSATPSVPAGSWSGESWTFWQFGGDGHIPGTNGRVDLDHYNGTDLTPVTVGADFAVAVSGPREIEQGASGTFSVAVGRDWFTLPVAVTVGGLPASIVPALASPTVTADSTTFTLQPSAGTPAGRYAFTVTATANGLIRTATGSLTVTDASPPKVASPRSSLVTSQLGATLAVRTTWSATDPSGISGYAAQRTVAGGAWDAVQLASQTSTSVVESLTLGPSYRYAADATDRASNTSDWRAGPAFKAVLVQQSSSGIKYSSGWKGTDAGSASGGRLKYASRGGAWASYRFTGRSIGWVASKGPARGKAAVYIDGHYRGTVNLHASSYKARQIVFVANWATSGRHTIKIVVKGTAGHPRVDVDAFVQLVSA